MKRAYVKPYTEVLAVEAELPLAMSVNNQKGSGTQLSRGLFDEETEDMLILTMLL